MNKVIYRCGSCGSSDIEGRAWVHLNNHTVTEDTESEALCNDCEFMGKPKIYRENRPHAPDCDMDEDCSCGVGEEAEYEKAGKDKPTPHRVGG